MPWLCFGAVNMPQEPLPKRGSGAVARSQPRPPSHSEARQPTKSVVLRGAAAGVTRGEEVATFETVITNS